MNKIFCTNCGNKMEFEKNKPNFCFKCGDSLNSLAKKIVRESVEEAPRYSDEEEEEFIPPSREIKLRVDLEESNFTIGDAIKHPVEPISKSNNFPKRGSGRKALNSLRDMFKRVGQENEE